MTRFAGRFFFERSNNPGWAGILRPEEPFSPAKAVFGLG